MGQILGYNGPISSVVHSQARISNEAEWAPALDSGQSVESIFIRTTTTGTVTVDVAIYDVTDTATTFSDAPRIAFQAGVSFTGQGDGALAIESDNFTPVDLSAHAGKNLFVVANNVTAGSLGNAGSVFTSAARNGDAAALPDPFGANFATGTAVCCWADTVSSAAAPTITDINTTNEVTPGEAGTLTGTNLTNATGLNIGSEAQADFAVASATSVTFTGTRGGNPYNQDLTATLLSPDGNATITVQQVPATGFAVTAANPNTTDDASLWTGLVDTATGDPVTAVNGDQFWAKTTIPGLAIQPDGTITADETGTFTGQFWRQSEGVWGSDQTVSFVVPDEWPFGKAIKPAAPQTWEWGGRHPKTGMRVRIFK